MQGCAFYFYGNFNKKSKNNNIWFFLCAYNYLLSHKHNLQDIELWLTTLCKQIINNEFFYAQMSIFQLNKPHAKKMWQDFLLGLLSQKKAMLYYLTAGWKIWALLSMKQRQQPHSLYWHVSGKLVCKLKMEVRYSKSIRKNPVK